MSQENRLSGEALTREQFSDVYAAGTSDGVVQLDEGEMKIEDVGYEGKKTGQTKRND
jgi:hypothetical protein